MSSKPGAAVSNDTDSTHSTAPSGSRKTSGRAGGSEPAPKKKTAGKKKPVAKNAARKSATGKAAGRKPDSKTGGKQAAAVKTAPEKKSARRPRQRPGLATTAMSADSVAQKTPAAHTNDPRSLAWMVAAAGKALNDVRENQTAKAAHLLNTQGADTAVPAEPAEFIAHSASHADTPAATPGSEVSATGIAPPQPEKARTAVEDTTPPVAVFELAEATGTTEEVAENEAADSALVRAVEPVSGAVKSTEAGVEDPQPWHEDATAGQAEPAVIAPLPPPAVAPRQRVPLRMMAGALLLAVVIGYGFLADEDEVVVPVAEETPAVENHTMQAAAESATKTAVPAATDIAHHEQPVAATADSMTTALPPDDSLVPQQAATTAPQSVSEPVSSLAVEPAATTESHTTTPVTGQPDYRNPGYGYNPPGWRQPGYRYPGY